MNLFRSSVLLLVAAGVFLAACDDGEPCGPGQELDRNYCIESSEPEEEPEEEVDSSDGGAGGMSSAAEAGDGDGDDMGETGEFGRVCTTDDECADPAPYCGIQPGSMEGTCTVQGCASSGTACPAGWKCLDFVDTCVVE